MNVIVNKIGHVGLMKVLETGGEVYFEYSVTNTDSPFHIEDIIVSCGCTTPIFTKNVYPPGGENIFKLGFNPIHRSGLNEKTVTVIISTEGKTIEKKITFKVEVK